MDWFFLASCFLLATIASHIECENVEEQTWSRNSLISGAWGQNPTAHGILSRAWREQLLNGTLREQSIQNTKEWSKARNIFMQHRLARHKSEELKKLVLSKVRRDQDLLAMQRMGGKPSFARGKRKKKKKKKRRRKKKKQRSKGHPRKKLKFDESCECGVAPKPKKHGGLWRVVNGDEASLGSHPWAVSLEQESGAYFCGGSIISNKYIVTAAHCVTKGQRVWVHIGDHDKTTSSETNSIRIEGKAKPHPKYNGDNYENDVAIVKLDEEINFKDFSGTVAPVCLARKRADSYEDSEVVVAGWGATSEGGFQATVLMEATLMGISNSACGSDYIYDKSLIRDVMLCAVGEGKDACQGDSGGPLVAWDDKRTKFIQVGVVSWGYGCARPDAPGVYARVSKLEKWVLNQARKGGKFCKE